jgi:hypothetical protein
MTKCHNILNKFGRVLKMMSKWIEFRTRWGQKNNMWKLKKASQEVHYFTNINRDYWLRRRDRKLNDGGFKCHENLCVIKLNWHLLRVMSEKSN